MPFPLPFMQPLRQPAMGLSALAEADWLWLDERFAAETAERTRLVVAQPAVVHAMLPEALPAAHELLALVRAWLAEHRPDDPQPRAAAEPPLLQLGRLVQEDFCLLQDGAGGPYRLTGAILCFPAHWRLADKIGQPLDAIHAPVPGYAERLAVPVARVFATLQVGRPMARANWTIVDSPTLFHPQPRGAVRDLSSENAGKILWLRVERQTLRRLPGSTAAVFGIRTLIEPLHVTAGRPGAAQALAAAIRALPPRMAAYKGIPAIEAPLLGFLDRAAEQPGRAHP